MSLIFRNDFFTKALWISIFCIMGSHFLRGDEKRKFEHPSIINTQKNLAALRKTYRRNRVTKAAFEKLKKSKYANLKRPHTPYAVVKVVASGTCKEEDAFRNDAQAAHALALMWVLTKNKKYCKKSMEILNDWAKTYKEIVDQGGNGEQARLETAWNIPVWVAAADIIRYYDKGAAKWKNEDIQAFDKFLNNMLQTARKTLHRSNNWGTTATLAVMCAAVYQDDEAAYKEAIDYHKKHLAKISKKDGSLGPDYLRDPWHPQYTLLTWIQICEIAWNQGDDLYDIKLDGQSEPRLALCLEHFSKLFLGKLPNPKGLKRGNYKDAHRKRQGYEMAYNHYIKRKKMEKILPTFNAMVPDWRPGGIDCHFIGWDSLTHGAITPDKKRK